MTREGTPIEPTRRQPPETVVAQIRKYVEPFLSAIGCVAPDDERNPPGDHLGTGAFVSLSDLRYLLTCDHVAKGAPGATLGCDLFESGAAVTVANQFISSPFPTDAAVSPITDKTWSCVTHNAKCLTLSDFALTHNPVSGEYLYVAGYPGKWGHAFPEESHHVALAELFTVELSYDPALKTEYQQPVEGYHLFLDCNPEHVQRLVGDQDWVSKLGGLSGSLVWNTRYKEITERDEEWSPADLRITALVWAHTAKAGVLIATPVQYIRAFLARF